MLRDKRMGTTTPVLLKHHGLKGTQAVVILASTANGKLLPPFLILQVEQNNYIPHYRVCQIQF